MSSHPRKVVGMFALLLGVWVGVYWLYKKADPPITFDEVAAPPLETQPLAAVETVDNEPAPRPGATAPLRKVVEKPRFTSYTVRKGDTSWESISRRVYGDRKHWRAIAESNPLVTASKLIEGVTQLKIPVDPTNIQGRIVQVPLRDPPRSARPEPAKTDSPNTDSPKPAATPRDVPASSTTVTAATTYTVRDGDTLSEIAKSVYGKSSLWELIYNANRDKLDSPSRVKRGMVLTIPAR
ncbi:MAG: LysM peptidoglycan-binding domain-containing protein [Phycisphaerales bacterium]